MNPLEQQIAAALQTGEIAPEDALAAVQELMADPEMGLMADPEEQARADKQAYEDRKQRLASLGHRLYTDAQTQVQLRQTTEERWFQDVRQFNGLYDPGTFTEDNMYGSRVFVPLTRRLVNLCKARLFDMLFPSEIRNYILTPTPVPDMDMAHSMAEQLPAGMPLQTPEGQPLPAGQIQQSIKMMIDDAKTRNDGMQREIDDQLAECHYTQAARDAIHDAVLYGTGVLKGPTAMLKKTKRWQVDQATGSHVMFMEEKAVPVTARVDLWNFFPDMSNTTIKDCEIVFERHFLSKKQLSDLKNMPDVDKDALREILEGEPTTSVSNYRERLRSINGASGAPDKRYELWEYHGPISVQDLQDCGCEMEDEDLLNQYTGIVWFSQGVVIKAALNPLDSGELPYRVFTWQKDESSIFGFGLPYEVRDQQTSANSSFRAMLDNMGLCVMPQVIIDDASIEPVNGSYGIEPGKFWRNKRPGSDARQGLQFVNIESRLQELQAIFAASKSLIEEVGTMPGFMQGQDAPAKMQSATEASISWTAANLWVRRCVRDWDDDIVTPMLTSYYDWNMQYSEKEEIKGDSKVRALGIAALVELEGQASRLQMLAQAAQGMGIMLSSQYSMLREYSRSLKLDPDLWLPSEQEIKKMKEQEAKQGPKPDIEAKKIEVAEKSLQLKAELGKMTLDQRDRDLQQRQRSDEARMQLEITDTAAKMDMTHEQAQAKYGAEQQRIATEMADRQASRDHRSQMLNAEMQFAAQTGSGV